MQELVWLTTSQAQGVEQQRPPPPRVSPLSKNPLVSR